MRKTSNESLAKNLRRINRELEMKYRAEHGDTRPRSKSWDSRLSNKQDRRRFKQNAKKLLENHYDEE